MLILASATASSPLTLLGMAPMSAATSSTIISRYSPDAIIEARFASASAHSRSRPDARQTYCGG